MSQVWRFPAQPLQNSAGVAVTAAALTGSGVVPLPQLPPVYQAGARLVLKATVEVTSTSATPTLTLGWYVGTVGQAIGSRTVIATSAALPISATATAWAIIMEYNGTFRTLSPSAGVINGQGKIDSWINVGLTGDATVNPMPTTAAARTVSTLNTSQVNEFDVGVTLSSVTGAPSVTVTNLWAELSG